MTATAPARESGVLLHITSLPSGRLDEDAYRFVDWLVAAGQSWWQLLPLHIPDEHGSPYSSGLPLPATRGCLPLRARGSYDSGEGDDGAPEGDVARGMGAVRGRVRAASADALPA